MGCFGSAAACSIELISSYFSLVRLKRSKKSFDRWFFIRGRIYTRIDTEVLLGVPD